MWTSLIGGIIIGLGTDWLGRFILPILAGLISCLELFFMRLKSPLKSRHLNKMKETGMSESEIEELKETLNELDTKTLDLGMSPIKIYSVQFIQSYFITLLIAIITGLVAQLFS